MGVPQGSILDPHAVSYCDVDQYTDDTLISYSDSSTLLYIG